jgi:alanine dehydrogenase
MMVLGLELAKYEPSGANTFVIRGHAVLVEHNFGRRA